MEHIKILAESLFCIMQKFLTLHFAVYTVTTGL